MPYLLAIGKNNKVTMKKIKMANGGNINFLPSLPDPKGRFITKNGHPTKIYVDPRLVEPTIKALEHDFTKLKAKGKKLNPSAVLKLAMSLDLKTDPLGLQKLARINEELQETSTLKNLKKSQKSQITREEITEIRRLYNLATRDTIGKHNKESAKMMFQKYVEGLIASGKAKRSEIEEFLSQ